MDAGVLETTVSAGFSGMTFSGGMSRTKVSGASRRSGGVSETTASGVSRGWSFLGNS